MLQSHSNAKSRFVTQRVQERSIVKSYRKELWFDIQQRREFVNITPQVQQCLQESGIKEGFVLCNHKQI